MEIITNGTQSDTVEWRATAINDLDLNSILKITIKRL